MMQSKYSHSKREQLIKVRNYCLGLGAVSVAKTLSANTQGPEFGSLGLMYIQHIHNFSMPMAECELETGKCPKSQRLVSRITVNHRS